MKLVPASPRARRRLVWAAFPAALAATGVAVVLILPDKGPQTPNPTGTETAEASPQLAAAPVYRVSAAEHRAIDAVLDRFIPDALAHKDLTAAWQLAGPELRSAQTYAQWRAGTTPIPYYPAAGNDFHNWRTIDAGPRYVIFNLLVEPTPGANISSFEYSGEVVKRDGRWLVNRFYTIAIFHRPTKTAHEVGPADFATPGPPASAGNHAALGDVGLLPIAGILALILLVPLAFGGLALLRARRWRRQVRACARTELPPLPKGYLRERPERPESAGRH